MISSAMLNKTIREYIKIHEKELREYVKTHEKEFESLYGCLPRAWHW